MEKRLLTAILLSIGILFGWQFFMKAYYPPKPAAQLAKNPETAAPTAVPAEGPAATTPAPKPTPPGPTVPAAAPKAEAAQEPIPSVEPRAAAAAPLTSKEAVARAQTRLRALGYDAGPADGAAGPKTLSAIRRFQADKGLKVTGQLDPETVRTLGL